MKNINCGKAHLPLKYMPHAWSPASARMRVNVMAWCLGRFQTALIPSHTKLAPPAPLTVIPA